MGLWRPDRQDLAGRREQEGVPRKGAIQARMRGGQHGVTWGNTEVGLPERDQGGTNTEFSPLGPEYLGL